MSTPNVKAVLRFAAALSTNSDTTEAIAEVCREATADLDARPNLAMVFVSHHHGPDFEPVAAGICQRTHTENLLGCTGEAIVSGHLELEGRPALALWLAHLPDVTIRTAHLEFEQTAEGATFLGWPDDLSDEWPAGSA
ncbi:MAG: hypothetical protein HY000_40350, partial [Planctomycetes bacterium]|nr:hypothetical protein [Planctomycetota bacterium]